MVPVSVTLNDPYARFQGHRVTVDALDVLCAQLTRDMFAIAKFLFGNWHQPSLDHIRPTRWGPGPNRPMYGSKEERV